MTLLACPKCHDLSGPHEIERCESCGARLGVGPYTHAYPKQKEKSWAKSLSAKT